MCHQWQNKSSNEEAKFISDMNVFDQLHAFYMSHVVGLIIKYSMHFFIYICIFL